MKGIFRAEQPLVLNHQQMAPLFNVTAASLNLVKDDNANEENENSSVYGQISVAIAWLTLALCFFGVIGNIFSIVIYANPCMKSPINVLLMGTSYIDLILSILSVPTFVIPGLYVYYKTPTLYLIMAYCSAYVYPLALMMQSASVWAFVVITIERWQAVCRPFRARWSSVQRSRLALVVVCLVAIAYNAVRFFEFRLDYSNDDDSKNGSNASTREYNEVNVRVETVLRNNTAYMNVYYIGMFLVTHFAIPFTILVVLNALIIRTICQSRARRRLLNRKERSEHRTAIMMIIVVLTFIGCYTLLFILNILEAADPDWFYRRHMALAFALNDISNVLVVLNAASTIIVYYFFSQKYRQLFVEILAHFCPQSCLKYLEPTTKSEPNTMVNEEDSETKKQNERGTALSPLLTNNRSGFVGSSCQGSKHPSATSLNSGLLTPQTAADVKLSLLTINHTNTSNSLTIENDRDGIVSDQDDN